MVMPLRHHQSLRGEAGGLGHQSGEMLPAHLEGGAEEAAGRGSTTQRNAGSTIPPMSMNALTGTIISGRTLTHSRNVTTRPPHGMSYPPTVGGIAIGRS